MTTFREATTTIADFTESENYPAREPQSLVRPKKLSGGATMWQARLVLSTLDPHGAWARKLRTAIRMGEESMADALLDAIYSRNSNPPPSFNVNEAPTSPPSATHSTVLPPSPEDIGRAAS